MTAGNYATATGDIPAKGVGYLTLYDAPSLRAGIDDLIGRGAVTIYASGPISEGDQDGLRLTYAYDMMRLSRSLRELDPPKGRLSLRPLTRPDGAVFLSIYNESVISLPGRPTQTIADLAWLISDDWKAGVAWLGDIPVGVYQCKCVGSIPEVSAIAILDRWRGKGLGRELLRQVLALLASGGPDRCTARIATNSSAFPLLRSEGFRAEELLSSWFQVTVLQHKKNCPRGRTQTRPPPVCAHSSR